MRLKPSENFEASWTHRIITSTKTRFLTMNLMLTRMRGAALLREPRNIVPCDGKLCKNGLKSLEW